MKVKVKREMKKEKRKNLIETDENRFTKKKKIQSIATNCVCILYEDE